MLSFIQMVVSLWLVLRLNTNLHLLIIKYWQIQLCRRLHRSLKRKAPIPGAFLFRDDQMQILNLFCVGSVNQFYSSLPVLPQLCDRKRSTVHTCCKVTRSLYCCTKNSKHKKRLIADKTVSMVTSIVGSVSPIFQIFFDTHRSCFYYFDLVYRP